MFQKHYYSHSVIQDNVMKRILIEISYLAFLIFQNILK